MHPTALTTILVFQSGRHIRQDLRAFDAARLSTPVRWQPNSR